MRKLNLLVAGCLLLAATANASESIQASNAPAAQEVTYEMMTSLEGVYSLPSGSHIKILSLNGGIYLELPKGQQRALHWDGRDRFVTSDGKVSVRQASNGNDVLFTGLE